MAPDQQTQDDTVAAMVQILTAAGADPESAQKAATELVRRAAGQRADDSD